MCHQSGRRLTCQVDQLVQPAAEAFVIEAVEGCRLAEPRHVGHDDAMIGGQPGDHGRPVDAAALDPAVQQHQRRAGPALEQRRRDAGDFDSPFAHR
jgi:hypothetical protein